MADLSKIKLNGTTYNFKDAEARNLIENFEETDPTVPAWAKASKKPTYTASEVGAAAINHKHNEITNYSPSSGIGAISALGGSASIKAENSDGSIQNLITVTPTATTIHSIVTPTADGDAANKKYVDDAVSGITIPTTVSSFTNDSGYQTSTQVQSAINTAIGNINSFEVEVVSTLPTSNIKDHTIYFVPQASNSSTHDEYMYINNAWELIGTTTVDLSNYLQKTDIAAWAKAANKPTYTAMEVGALPNTYTAPVTSVNGQTGAVSLSIPTVPTNVSDFTNDAGYLTSYTETDPTVPAWAKAASKPTYTATEVGALPSDTAIPSKVSDLNNDTGFITSAALPTKVSDLDNDTGYLTSFTETDPVFTASAAAGISSADITNWNSKTNNTGTVTSVRVQATAPVQSSVNTAQNTTLNTTISLASGYGDTQNPYASKTAKYVLAAPNAQNGVPTFRALVASDLPSIGNITNGGDITANATIANGDRLIINDESASKVINSSITFGTNTKQYLANNGTWQNAYDDSALAARVTALEELEWATYYSGRSNPSNTQGKNGDIYLQY